MGTQKEIEIVQHTQMNAMEIFLVEVMSRNPHGHEDLEIGMILEGNVTLFLEQNSVLLQTGDIYIINRHQIHSISSKGKNLILAAQIRTEFYRQVDYELEYLRFEDSVIREGAVHRTFQQIFYQCAVSYFQDTPFHALKSSSLMLELLYLLASNVNCHIASEKESVCAYHNTMRLDRIVDYVNQHYTERISLQTLADMEHVTECHISHFMQKMMGMSFQEYLSLLRFRHALMLIEKTDLKLLDISMESGFSSTRYMNRMFEKQLHCSAREYQKSKSKPVHANPPVSALTVQKRYDHKQALRYLASLYRCSEVSTSVKPV